MTEITGIVGGLGVLMLYAGLTGGGRASRRALMRRLDSLAEESGLSSLTGLRLLGASVGSLLLTATIVAGITSSLVVAVAIGAVLGWAPFAFVRSRRDQRRRAFREAWPDALATLVAAVRSGVSLAEACASLAGRGPRGLQPGFASFASSYRACGSFQASLQRLGMELADPVADKVVAALSLAHEVGGTDLVRVLRSLEDFVRADLRLRKEIESRWSWTVAAARVAAAGPWVVLMLMSARPEAAAAYNSSTGALVIGGGAVATAAGYRLMLRAGRLPEEKRLGR
jgi:tight adherence protein B